MEAGGAVKILYWADSEPGKLFLPDGIVEFEGSLANSYVSNIQARPGPHGGLYGFAVEFLTSFTLKHFLGLILDGIAYDLVKSGSKALVLRPFLTAYNALRKRNEHGRFEVHIEELLLRFQDSVVLIRDLGNDTILENLKPILHALALNYEHFALRSGEKPFTIVVPIVEDPSADRLCRFREVLDVDETIRDLTDARYLELWGAQYDFAATSRVYDLKRRVLLDEKFYTRSEYSRLWMQRNTAL